MLLFIQIVLTLLCLAMLLNAILNYLRTREDLRLARATAVPSPAPLISVCVPARNEAGNIGPCLRSLAAQDYPNFEVIVLDDCSDDGTGEIARAAAASDPRIRVMTGKPLEAGWIGKPHACHQMAQVAQGEYLLFTDADTLFQPQTLGTALRVALSRRADLLSGLPRLKVVGFWERISVPMLTVNGMGCLNLSLASSARFPLYVAASGAFLFFRRAAYEALGGHTCVSDHIVEDIALARAAKRAGLRFWMTDVADLVACRMYRSLRDVWEGFTKNFNTTFPGGLVLIAIAFLLAVFVWPPLAFLFGPAWGWPAAVATVLPFTQIVALGALRVLSDRAAGTPDLIGLWLTPVAAIFVSVIGLRSWSRSILHQPTPWRDRHYDLWNKSKPNGVHKGEEE